jgi:hypothetical protein
MPDFQTNRGIGSYGGDAPSRTRLIASTLVATLTAGILIVGPITSSGAVVSPADHPYLRLFTEVGDCSQVLAVNQLSGNTLATRLEQLRRWYVHFHSEGSNQFILGNTCRGSSTSTLAEKLSQKGTWTSNYRNGSFVSQANAGQVNFHEAEAIEREAPLAIGTYWPGNFQPNTRGDDDANGARLAQPISASATTVTITPVSVDARPPGTSDTWPYIDSRGTGATPGAHSSNTHDFVSWIRVGKELMQVIGHPELALGQITLDVRRGLWDTNPATHMAGTRVMAPTYIGNRLGEASLSGTPLRDSSTAPLRYALKVWKPGAYEWLARRIRSTFGPGLQGFNTIWLDVSSCHQDNHSDPYGNPVFGWFEKEATKLQAESYGAAQKAKLRGLRQIFPKMRFTGNNLFQNDACAYGLMGAAYDGGVIENYLQASNGSWSEQMLSTFEAMMNDWPAIYWARWDYGFSGNVAAYKRLTYGSVLLAYRSTDRRYQYGGHWDLDQPDELYFWDWGQPHGSPTGIEDLRIGQTSLFRRDFDNGIVIVNPSAAPITYTLEATFYDVVNKDGSGVPRAVTQVTIPAQDAAFLLR